MNNELIAQYIQSVIRNLPKTMRQDIAQELNMLISDMLEKRCGDILPSDRDINVVIAELGEPLELASKYHPCQTVLIGSSVFRTFRTTFTIVFVCSVFGITLGKIIELFSGTDNPWYQILFSWFVSLVQCFFIEFGIVAFIFALYERHKATYVR